MILSTSPSPIDFIINFYCCDLTLMDPNFMLHLSHLPTNAILQFLHYLSLSFNRQTVWLIDWLTHWLSVQVNQPTWVIKTKCLVYLSMSGALNAIPNRAILQVIISQTTNVSMIECLWKRPFPSSSSASISRQVYVITMHNKNFALRVALKERLMGTQKWSNLPSF